MKFLETYNNYSGPRVGDYVILDTNRLSKYPHINKSLNNYIGKIVHIYHNKTAATNNISYKIELVDVPEGEWNMTLDSYWMEDILYFGTKEEMKIKKQSSKFNL